MPTDSEGNRQDRPNASPDDRNSQELPASQVSSTRDPGSSASSSAPSESEDKDAIIESLRKEAAQRRVDAKELAELRAYRQEQEDAKLSDTQKHEKQRAADQERIAELELAKQEATIRADVKLAAAALGISVKLARLILPMESIEFDASGDPTNVAELLRAAVEEHDIPLNGAASSAANDAAANGSNGRTANQLHVSSGGAVNPARSSTNGSGLFEGDPQTVAARFARMSPSEYAAHASEYAQWLASNFNKLRR